MEFVEKTLISIGSFILFVVVSLLFLPSFLIVTYLEPVWKKSLNDVFGL